MCKAALVIDVPHREEANQSEAGTEVCLYG